MTGGEVSSGGEGVTHSPISTLTSAMIPSKGATIVVFSSSVYAARRLARA